VHGGGKTCQHSTGPGKHYLETVRKLEGHMRAVSNNAGIADVMGAVTVGILPGRVRLPTFGGARYFYKLQEGNGGTETAMQIQDCWAGGG